MHAFKAVAVIAAVEPKNDQIDLQEFYIYILDK